MNYNFNAVVRVFISTIYLTALSTSALAQSEANTPEKQVVTRWYELYSQGEPEKAASLFTEDTTWMITAGYPFSTDGGIKGRENVFERYFEKLGNLMDSRFEGGQRYENVRMTQNGNLVFSEGRVLLKPNGASYECIAPVMHVWRFENGKIAHLDQYIDTAVINAALAGNTGDCGDSETSID